MGFSQGLAAGSNLVRNIQNSSRQERQQQLTEMQNQMQLNQETGQLERTQTGQAEDKVKLEQLSNQMAALAEQNKALQSYKNADDISTSLLSWSDGNYQDTIKTLKRNQSLSKQLQENFDAYNFRPVDMEMDRGQLFEVLASQGWTQPDRELSNPEVVDKLRKSMMMIQGADGSWRPQSINSVIKQTNSLEYMKPADRDRLIQNSNNAASIIKGVGKSSIQMKNEQKTAEQTLVKTNLMSKALETGDTNEVMMAYMMTNPEKFLGKGGSQRRDALEQATTAFANSNPDATPAEWQNFYTTYTQKTLEGVSGVKEDKDINRAVSGTKAAKVNATPQELSSREQTTMAALHKTNPEEYKRVQKSLTTMKDNSELAINLDKILQGSGKKVDTDAIASIKDIAAQTFGIESEQVMNNIDFNTQSGMLLADYILSRSGTAASDTERSFLSSLMKSGKLADEVYVRKALESFRDGLYSKNDTIGAGIKDTAPSSVSKFSRPVKKAPLDLSKYKKGN